ncbi:MAG TPA: hypothetical protein VK099_08985 [Alcanivoracaceae bacterium]|nr:hypothetical protein [Alcanivoracaceae bacterium]
MAKTLALFDDGMATPFAWQRALQRGGLSQPPVVTTEPERLYHAERLIVATHQPLASTFKLFEASSLAEVLSTRITQNKPTLVVGSAVHACLAGGGRHDWLGFNLLPGNLKRFFPLYDDYGALARTPHIGWNSLDSLPPHPMWAGINSGAHAYFAHQYFVNDVPVQQQLAQTQHGVRFPSVFYQGNLCGVQFQPAISGAVGAQFIENFLRWRP